MTAGTPTASAVDDLELRREGERIAQLIEDLASFGGLPVRQRAEELVGRLVHLYGAGLAALIRIVHAAGLGDSLKARLGAEPLISSLLLLHGLHPEPAAAAALDPDAAPAARPVPAEGLVQIDVARGRGAEQK